MRREDSTVTGRLLYQRILSQHSGFTAEGAATVLTGADESYCSWPVHRELRFRDVVSYVVAQEYLCSHNFLRGTQTDIRRVVARISPLARPRILKCEACRAGFVLSNGTRYQCASHTNGGDDACGISLSVPRDRAERIILDFTKAELPRIIEDIERRFREPERSVDHGQSIAQLQEEIERLAAAIVKMGGSDALTEKLKARESELARLKAATASIVQPAYITSREPMERRVERMLDRLAKGGEVAQGVLRELFPAGFWLVPDASGRYLWAVTQTASPDLALHVDSNGNLPAQYWPRVYDAAAIEVGNSMVAGAGFVTYLHGCRVAPGTANGRSGGVLRAVTETPAQSLRIC